MLKQCIVSFFLAPREKEEIILNINTLECVQGIECEPLVESDGWNERAPVVPLSSPLLIYTVSWNLGF
jgi:hypothetical protein